MIPKLLSKKIVSTAQDLVASGHFHSRQKLTGYFDLFWK